MEKPAVPGLFIGPDRARRQLSREVMAEGKALASNSLCVVGRAGAGTCAGAINVSASTASIDLSAGPS